MKKMFLVVFICLVWNTAFCIILYPSNKKEEKILQFIQEECIYYDINFLEIIDDGKSDSVKSRTISNVLKLAGDKISPDIKQFLINYSSPNLENPSKHLIDAIYESVRRQRKARWVDAATAFGRGMQGKDNDLDNSLCSRIHEERKNLYLQLKEIYDSNKINAKEWELMFWKDLLHFIKSNDMNQKYEWIESENEFIKT